MWLGFHKDMANPESEDPVKRESTRLTCVATGGGQTSMDMAKWREWISGYDKPHRNQAETFDAEAEDEMRKIVEDVSALNLICEGDPPIYMSYGMHPDDPIPEDPDKARGWKIHHVMFGIKLKEVMDSLGIEAHLLYPDVETPYASRDDFLISKLEARRISS